MQSLLQDLRFALRMLRKNPGFTVVALLTLALGIGANTAIFSVVYSVLLRPLPFSEPDRIVRIFETRLDRGWTRASFTHANFWDVKEMNRTFDDIGAFQFGSMNLTGLGHPERLGAGRVSAGFFQILRVQPVLGRTFMPGEDQADQENQFVLLSNDWWRDRLGADSTIVGTSLVLDDESYTVIGVLPPGNPWLNSADVFTPMVDPEPRRVSFELSVIGRLGTGVTLEAALSDLGMVARRLEQSYPEDNAGMGISGAPESDWIATSDTRRALMVLFGAVGLLLLIACVNLANLLMAKATARQRETAVRVAMGAGRGRIARQVLTESLLLSLMGAGLGLLLAVWLVEFVRAWNPGDVARMAAVSVNTWVLWFTLAVGVLAGVLSGLLPALQAPKESVVSSLREGGRGVAGSRTQRRLRSALVATEVALSLTLLVGAGLLIRSFNQLMGVDRGFETENRVVAAINLPGSYDGPRVFDLMQQLLTRVEALPQVERAAAIQSRPIAGGNPGMGIAPAGTSEDPDENTPWAGWRLVTGEYFETLGIPLLQGRTFDERDAVDESSPDLGDIHAILSQRLAELMFPGEDPIGRQVLLWRGQNDLQAEVVGVVGNMRERGLDADPTLTVYLPYYGLSWSPLNAVVHVVGGPPTVIIPAMRSILAELDPNLPLSNIQTMDEIVGSSVASQRFNMLMLALLAAVALLLALAGIYGVQSYSVARRTSEIGVRVAFGASTDSVIKLIVGQGMLPALIGIGVGLLGAFALSRFLTSLLYGIAPSDPTTYVGVALILGAAALVSCYLPARRALKVDPVEALREE